MTNKIIASLAVVLAVLVTPVSIMAQKKKARPAVPRTAGGHPDLSGVWQPGSDKPGTWEEANQGVGVAEPGQGGIVKKGANPAYQPWAAKLVLEAYNRRNADDYTARCIPELELGGLSLYPNQFVQTPNLIVILIEVRHAFRLIPLNEKHPEDLDPAWLGDSVGHWEGDTLVVDVVGFKERVKGSKINTDALHIVERFTRVDYNTIEYSATIEDPKALLHPYTPTRSRANTCCGPELDCKSTCARTIRTPPLSRSSIKKVSSRGKNDYEPPRTFEIPDWIGSTAVAASNRAHRAKCSSSAGGDRA